MFKKICYIFAILFLFSCIRDNRKSPGVTEDVELMICANILSPRAVTKLVFSENDAIGIYPVSYVNGVPGTLGDVRNPLNREYFYEGRDWQAVGGDEIFLTETLVDVYAYYPYDPELSSALDKTNVSRYPYSIPVDQTVSGPEVDFLWGKVDGLSFMNNRANIQFRHLLSRLVINLYYNDANRDEISDVQIHNVYISCLIDLRTGTVTPNGMIVPVKPYQYPIPESGYDFSYESIVIPQTITAESPVISLIYNGERLLYKIQGEQVLLPGRTYTLNLGIGNAEPQSVSVYEQNHYLKRTWNED